MDRARESRSLLIQAVASIAVALGIMVLMFAPAVSLSLVELNRLVILPATVIQLWAGRRFYRPALRAARHGATNMDTLVAIGTTAAWGYSVVVTLVPDVVIAAGLEPVTWFDSSTIVIGLVLLGRWLEARAKVRTAGAIRRLVGLSPATARLVADGGDRDVALEAVRGRRPPPRPARRHGPGGRHRDRGRLRRRHLDADRRTGTGGGRGG